MKHGGDLGEAAALYGGSPGSWLDLSTGINPHVWPIGAIPAHVWHDLPRQDALSDLLNAARTTYKVPDHLGICASPGTEAILSRLPDLLPAGSVTVPGPTYSSHAMAWRAAGRIVHQTTHRTDCPTESTIVVLVNPNNPDGHTCSLEDQLKLADQLATRDGCLIVDEAFCDIDPQGSLIPHIGNRPILVLRSFGKFFGLAGVRLGFLVGAREFTDRLEGSFGGWAVSGPALEVGTAALRDQPWQEEMRRRLAREALELDALFANLGLSVVGGTSLFRLVETDRATELHEILTQGHIWTRIFDYNDKWIRIGLPGSREKFDRFASALTTACTQLDSRTCS